MTHKKWGQGIIIKVDNEKITVNFESVGDKVFQVPQSFERSYLSFLDLEKNRVFLADLKKRRDTENTEEKRKYQEIAQSIPTKQRSAITERDGDDISYFYVFQGSSYSTEKDGGYIWAPIQNDKGQSMHHWNRMLDVRKGDVIFHGFGGSIAAISIAKGEAYPKERPISYGDENWIQTGRRIDLGYHVLKKPLLTKDFIDDIKKFSGEKYSPFNINGTGNMGYLFNINPVLVRVFSEWIVKHNPEINNIREIAKLL